MDAAPGRSLEPRQRWRLTVARAADAPRQTHPEAAATWEEAFSRSGLPLAAVGGARGRRAVTFGASFATGVALEADLIDVVLAEALPAWRVREALEGIVPPGWGLVDLYDVWLGAPGLSVAVGGAEYRIVLAGDLDPDTVQAACERLMAAAALPVHRQKSGGEVEVDVRPLLLRASVADPGPPVTIRLGVRIHPSLGTGRPEEMLAALGGMLGAPIEAITFVRERLLEIGGPDLD